MSSSPNVVARSLTAVDDRIAQLEAELADLSSDDDDSGDDEPPAQTPQAKKQKAQSTASTPTDPLPLYCKVCNVSVTSQELIEEHIRGKKHKLAVKASEARAKGRYCDVCEIVFTGPDQLAEHKKGRKHSCLLYTSPSPRDS